MKRPSAWFWVAIAYLVATVAYNLWTQWAWLASDTVADRLGLAINLGCKALAIGFLIFRRPVGVYLLAVSFLVGLSGTVWGFYLDSSWKTLPLLTQISRINGFVISLVIVLYMAALLKRGAFAGRPNQDTT